MKIVFRLALTFAAIISAMSVLGSIATSHWLGELFAQPRPQYVIGLVLCAVPIVRQFPRAGWCILLPVLFNSFYIAPLYFRPAEIADPGAAELTAVHANVDRFNSAPERAIEWVRAQRSDIVSLQEVTPEFEKTLTAALPDYSVVLSHSMTNSHGSVVLVRRDAKIEIVSAQIIHLPATSERPLIEYVFRIGEREVVLLSLFLSRPIWQRHLANQSLELREAARWSREQQEAGREVIIVGDLNLTPWSPRFGALCADGNLINSQDGFGLQSSWPATLPGIMGLPIDHCLHSAGIRSVSRSVGRAIGSDHRPLLLRLHVMPRG